MDSRFFGATLLVAGTAIGAGMLGMPIVTGISGFIPSLFVMVISWAFLLLTSFLMVDVNLSLKREGNIISMAAKTLGIGGKIFSWIVYLFLLYALDVAFIAGGSKILADLFPLVPSVIFPPLIALPLGWFVFLGLAYTDWLNRFLVIGKLGIGYVILICFVPTHVRIYLLSHIDLAPMVFTVPVVIQAFGFHTVVPSLVSYLHNDAKKIRLALFSGSLIALVVYVIWEFLVLGVVPVAGDVSLAKAYIVGDVSTSPLIKILHNPLISVGAIIFAAFSIGTAFLGVSLGLFDFLIDGLNLPRTFRGKLIAYCLTTIPPLIFVLLCERIFIVSLEYAGIFVSIIFGLIPILMAYTLPPPSYWRTSKGKFLLVIAALFFMLAIVFELVGKFGYLNQHITHYLQ